ncbi:unnamed protein product [Protopolystoma xenopodis]|uniref:Uncharacterized protein n=1 Tax=Protopolystoma xenopodis TaxID=117903 RepID=A0A448WU30_9PLAT|nr:unnamed protein product [Protopolystoma xenopodis]
MPTTMPAKHFENVPSPLSDAGNEDNYYVRRLWTMYVLLSRPDNKTELRKRGQRTSINRKETATISEATASSSSDLQLNYDGKIAKQCTEYSQTKKTIVSQSAHLTFLLCCKRYGITHKFRDLKRPYHSDKANKHLLSPEDFKKLPSMTDRKLRRISDLITKWHDDKLCKLGIFRQPMLKSVRPVEVACEVTTLTDQHGDRRKLLNLSSIPLNPETTEFLEKGLNFSIQHHRSLLGDIPVEFINIANKCLKETKQEMKM